VRGASCRCRCRSSQIGLSLTPVRIHLPARHSHTLVVEKAGYRPFTAHIGRRLAWVPLVQNVIFSLGLTELVDLVTGAAWEFNPDYVKADLAPISR